MNGNHENTANGGQGNQVAQGAKPDAQSSGFTANIETEVDNAGTMPVDHQFHDIKEIYVSDKGPTRVLSATRYGKHYALKCLKADYLYTPVYRQALVKEFEIGLRLDHPNICRTIGMEEIDGYGPVIIMELVDGITLQDFIGTRRFNKDMARKVARQLMDALDYMHGKQIYHRDLKPANIMITYGSYNVKVIDFSLSDGNAYSVLKTPAGTMGYIAPEQLQQGSKADARADIYSFGMVLQEMARATDDHSLMRLGKACAQRDPARRPADIGEVRQVAKEKPYGVSTVVLGIICLLFVCCIALGIQRRNAVATAPATTHIINADSNDVVDMHDWPTKK